MGFYTYLLIASYLLYHGIDGSHASSNTPLVRAMANVIRILLRQTRPLSDDILDILYTSVMGEMKELPPIDNKILLMSATELAQKIRNREVSSEEAVRAYIERARSVNPMINAIVDERYEDALKEARDVDLFLARSEKSAEEIANETPLLGMPFSCKEGIGVKGLALTWGLVRAKDHKAAFDADSTAQYRKAGAIPIAVTNVPELLRWWESENHVFGLTTNPYDHRRTAGGSSGGECALIASAGAPFGIGNDVAGSLRIPASFNGVYAHKPSKGIVSNNGDIPSGITIDQLGNIYELVSTGPLCRYAQDLPLLLKVLSDNDARIELDKKVDFRKLTVYYMEEFPGYLLEPIPMVKDAITKAVTYLEKKFGIKAIKLKIDELLFAQNIWESKFLENGSPPFSSLLASDGKTINLQLELTKSILGTSDHTIPAVYYAIIERRKKDKAYYKYLNMYQNIERAMNNTLLEKDAILLLPAHPEPAPHHLETIPKYPNIGYSSIFNVLGLPSTSIPVGLSDKGLPIGIQAVSGRFHDRLSLAAALELDKLFKGWKSPCPIII